MIPVIVALKNGDLKRTNVSARSVQVISDDNPQSFEEAAMEQHPDIARLMGLLVEAFAECSLYDTYGACSLFDRELNRAMRAHKAKGHKARFRHVEYDEEDSL